MPDQQKRLGTRFELHLTPDFPDSSRAGWFGEQGEQLLSGGFSKFHVVRLIN